MDISRVVEKANILRGQVHILKEVLSQPEGIEWYSVEVHSDAAKVMVEVDYTISQYEVREMLQKELKAKERYLRVLEKALRSATEVLKDELGDGHDLG